MDKATNQNQDTLILNPRLVTLKDIALHAKVSEVAAGRVLLGSGKNSVRVGAQTADRIRQIADQLGYQPNRVAQQLAGKRSKVVGVIIDSYAPQIDFVAMSEMERQTAKRGYRFMVGQSHGELDRIEAYSMDFLQRGIEGIICISHQYPATASKISDILGKLKNVVYIYRPSVLDENTCFVDIDIAEGIYQAFEYLVQKGRKRIAFLPIHLESATLTSRYEGYMRALSGHNGYEPIICKLNDLGLEGNLDDFNEPKQEIINLAVKKLVEEHHADAILATNDIMGCRVIKAIHQRGLKVPDDVAVIGFDNLQIGTISDPELTTIDQQSKDLSHAAIDMLIDLIEGKDLSRDQRQIVIKPKLVIRDSA
jgi:DNA-binding LacI/PurR family transcriptional regulator